MGETREKGGEILRAKSATGRDGGCFAEGRPAECGSAKQGDLTKGFLQFLQFLLLETQLPVAVLGTMSICNAGSAAGT
jgi:hypothetical protein